jgi:hypothetical protein
LNQKEFRSKQLKGDDWMFYKITILALCLCSLCIAAEGLPDPNDWFIQPLNWDYPEPYELQMSDTHVIWEGHDGTYFYDGTGVYSLGWYGGSVSSGSLVCPTGEGIRFIRGDVNKVIPFTQESIYSSDVYENTVVWQAGGDYFSGGDIYYWYDDPIGDIFWLTSGAKTPKIGPGIIAWLGYDGNDFEVFILKDQTIQQLTNNTINESDLQMSDDGQLAWMSWKPLFENVEGYVHYYDGQRTRQMTVGNTHSWLWGVSNEGVLYTAGYHPDYYPGFETVLLYHNGLEDKFIAGADSPQRLPGASIGNGSIAWIEYDEAIQKYRVSYLKGQELVQWPIGDLFVHEFVQLAVWGDRLVWSVDNVRLYFGEHLRRNCVHPPRMDTNDDCQVNLSDFAVFAGEWLTCGYRDPADCR